MSIITKKFYIYIYILTQVKNWLGLSFVDKKLFLLKNNIIYW